MEPLILNIDTARSKASVCLSIGASILRILSNEKQTDHASWLHLSIQSLLASEGKTLKALDAIAVTEGPGSYTGLRVGMAAAKGFCYALSIPLIMVNTLKVMACSASSQLNDLQDHFLCPMIDARRMEVFTAIYSIRLEEIIGPLSLVLDEELSFFEKGIFKNKLIFFGDGSLKFKAICPPALGNFSNFETDATHLAMLSSEMYRKANFSDPVDAVPFYLKAFYMKRAD